MCDVIAYDIFSIIYLYVYRRMSIMIPFESEHLNQDV